MAALLATAALSGCRVEQRPASNTPSEPAAAPAAAPAPPVTASPPASPPPTASAPVLTAPPPPSTPAQAPQSPPALTPEKAAAGAIGRIDSFEGDVRIARAGGARNAEAGATIEEGDTITAGDGAWALLAMTDAATVTLRSASEVRFETYRYNAAEPAASSAAVIVLARGAFRSITGEIGRTNPESYEVKTPGASIAVKGTDHEPAYYPPAAAGQKPEVTPGTYDKVNSGEAEIRSAARTIPAKPGQIVYMNDDAKARPQLLAREPAFYQRHAELDKLAEVRRTALHRSSEEERRKRARAQQGAAAKAAAPADAAKTPKGAVNAKSDHKAASRRGEKATSRPKQRAHRKDAAAAGTADRMRTLQRGDKGSATARGETSR